MKKILVPTDFSSNSKSGVRFAIHWAAQQNLELVFIHVLNIMTPTRWSKATYDKYIAGELQSCRDRLHKFIAGIYKSMNVTPGVYSAVLFHNYDPAKTILEYCGKENSIDCICISTNGAGTVMKLFGTNTSALIAKSPIPVLAIPQNYRPREINSVLYATDFNNYKNELATVLDLATSFKATVNVVHLAWPDERRIEKDAIKMLSGNYDFGLNIFVEDTHTSLSLTERLQNMISKIKPSMVIMFSNKERNLFQKLFLSSKAQELSFRLKKPLLVYRKSKES